MASIPMAIEGAQLQDLNELQDKSFRLTLVLVLIATQVALLAGDLIVRPLPTILIAAGLDFSFFCVLNYFLFMRYPQSTRYLFVLGLIIGNIIFYSNFPSSVVLYFFGIICLIISMHLRRSFAVGFALVSSVLVVTIGTNESLATLFSAVFLIWFILLTNFGAYQNLIEALQMAWDYQSYAIAQMEEARDHRAELMKLTKTLQETRNELELANIQLRHAHNTAEEAGRLKAQFAANVSHEFRTPINLIVGFSEMIISNPQAYHEPLPRAYWSDLQTICECAKHLQSLINDVLDISQIEAGYMAMVKEFVDPRQVILDATNLAREMIEGSGLAFNLIIPDRLPSMWIDRTRIRQVLLNILSNAVRFTNQGSITLQAKADPKQLTISITDTGTGIRREDIAHIFDAYYQAEESDFRRSTGSGLGLTLSKQFVTSHGGSLSVESSGISGKGSIFTVALPLEDYTVHHPTLQEGKQRIFDGDCFVVLDNDPAILKLFERYTSRHRALGALTIEEAFHLWKTVNPTAIVVGNDRDREELLHGIQESNYPIAMISCPMPSGRRALQVEGVVDFLVKPVSQQTLYSAIERVKSPVSNVLVIDDDQDIVRMFSRMIQTMPGVREVWKAYSGSEGLALMRHQSPDVIILDVLMPDLDGLTTLQLMKIDPELCEIPVIIVSASGAGEAIVPLTKGKITLETSNGFQPLQLVHCVEALLDSFTPPIGPVL